MSKIAVTFWAFMAIPTRSTCWGETSSSAMWRPSKTCAWSAIWRSTVWSASWTGRRTRSTALRKNWGCTTSSTANGSTSRTTTSTTCSSTWISRGGTSRICYRSTISYFIVRSTCPGIPRWSSRRSWRSLATTTTTRISSPKGGGTSMSPIIRLMKGWRGLKSISERRIPIIWNWELSDRLLDKDLTLLKIL